jgi:hypothetical protein
MCPGRTGAARSWCNSGRIGTNPHLRDHRRADSTSRPCARPRRCAQPVRRVARPLGASIRAWLRCRPAQARHLHPLGSGGSHRRAAKAWSPTSYRRSCRRSPSVLRGSWSSTLENRSRSTIWRGNEPLPGLRAIKTHRQWATSTCRAWPRPRWLAYRETGNGNRGGNVRRAGESR